MDRKVLDWKEEIKKDRYDSVEHKITKFRWTDFKKKKERHIKQR